MTHPTKMETTAAMSRRSVIFRDCEEDPHDSASSLKHTTGGGIWHTSKLSTILTELFLPVGYPNTVREGYFEYQCYDSLQGLCSYLRGVLCNAQMLHAAGVGNSTSEIVSYAVATTWALKDGVSMVGGLCYSYNAASYFDAYVKEFRLFADLSNDVGMTLDMLIPYFPPQYVLLLSSLSGLCKTMCGISAGATKSSITHHFAMAGNMADLNAKEATQETLVSLVGMLFGVLLATQLSQLQQQSQSQVSHEADTTTPSNAGHQSVAVRIHIVQWSVFLVLTAVHVWANYRGVMVLRLRTLNPARAMMVFHRILDPIRQMIGTVHPSSVSPAIRHSLDLDDSWDQLIPAPELVQESILASTYHLLFGKELSDSSSRSSSSSSVPIVLSAEPARIQIALRTSGSISSSVLSPSWPLSLSAILAAGEDAFMEFHTERYILAIEETEDTRSPKQMVVLVALLKGATVTDQVKAFLHAVTLAQYLEAMRASSSSTLDTNYTILIHDSYKVLQRFFINTAEKRENNLMETLAKKGWDIERVYLGFNRRRMEIVTTESTTPTTPAVPSKDDVTKKTD